MTDKEGVLITGGSNLIGIQIRKKLTSYEWNDLYLNFNGNLLDELSVANQLKSSSAQMVVHLAEYRDVKQSENQADDYSGRCYGLNTKATEYLANMCRETNKHLIYFSTGYVFDGERYETYNETDEPNPLGWYAKTKYWGELKIQESGCGYTVIRINYPFGREETLKFDWLQKLKQKLFNGEKISLLGDQWFNPAWIDDITRAVDKVIQQGPTNNIYHIGTHDVITPYEAGVLLCERLEIRDNLIKRGSWQRMVDRNSEIRKIYPQNSQLNTDKYANAFSIHMIGFIEALDKAIKKLDSLGLKESSLS